MIPVSFTDAALSAALVIGGAFLVLLLLWLLFSALLSRIWHSASLAEEREEHASDDPLVPVDHPMWFPPATRRSRGEQTEDF